MPRLPFDSNPVRDIVSRRISQLRWRLRRLRRPLVPPPRAYSAWEPLALRLHDEVGQWLALAMLQVDGIRASRPGSAQALDQLRGSLERAAQAVREVTRTLDAEPDASSLLTTIEHALADSPWAGYPLQRGLHPGLAKLAAAACPLAVRAVCELVGNAHRHAHAACVTLCVWQRGAALHIQVSDDGAGLANANDPRHFGLRSLRRQIASEGGQWRLRTSPGLGTRVALELPLRNAGCR
jgi:signal transduction histidine kinase